MKATKRIYQVIDIGPKAPDRRWPEITVATFYDKNKALTHQVKLRKKNKDVLYVVRQFKVFD